MKTVLYTGTTPPQEPPPGLHVVHAPALVRQALPFPTPTVEDLLQTPSHLLFYSQFAAELFLDHAAHCLLDVHHFWAVGARTGALLEDHTGIGAHVPGDQSFQGLLRALEERATPAPLISFSLQGILRDFSPLAAQWGVAFHDIPIYESAPAPPEALRDAFDELMPRWVAITSARGVDSLVDALGTEHLQTCHLAAIGPSTAARCDELGLPAQVVCETPDRRRLLDLIAAHHEDPT